MNRSTQSLRLAFFGAAALFALGAGCQREKAKAPEAQAQQTPTFEAALPEGQGQYGEAQKEQVDQEKPAGIHEREVCSGLTEHATLRVEDVEGGVAIVAVAKPGADPAQLRGDALHAAYMIAPPVGMEAHARPSSASDRCSLFELGDDAGRTTVAEQGNELRIIVLARDPSDLGELRSDARSFVDQWSGQQQ